MEDDNGAIVQESLAKVEKLDFCVSGPAYGQAKQGSYSKATNYVASANLKMIDLGKYSKSYGFLGIAFNMMDGRNYDIAYVRPHATTHCWELGYVEDGLLFGRDFGTCNGLVTSQFNIGIKVENGKGYLFVNGGQEAEFTPYFPSQNKIATALRNNMKGKMTVNDLEMCQEISCVAKDAAGKTVVYKTGQEYKEANMAKCESCKCGLYGQIKCGCKSASEQGLVCGAGKVAAVGDDCCARCVPPAASCTAGGDPHYRGFDGRAFDFQGSCTYCLIKTADFQVDQHNRGYGRVAVNEVVYLNFDGDKYELDTTVLYLTPRDGVKRAVAVPFKKHYTTEDYVYCATVTQCNLYIKNAQMLTIYSKFGTMRAWIHGTYYERTECLCGRWDGNPSNDGTDVRSVSNDGDTCPNPPDPGNPCDKISREERNWAEQYCSRYKQEPFKSCPVSVTSYFEDCKFDACVDPTNDENVCSNAATYANACAQAGYPVDGWRTRSFCPMECENGMVFNSCGHGCFATCADPVPSDCEETCVEGCYCPPGTVLEDGHCIDAADCRCLFEGKFLENGNSWNDTVQCETCSCVDGGIIECDPLACDKCPAGEVPVSFEGSCCPFCLADWASEKEDTIEVNEKEGPANMICELDDKVLVAPEDITWKYGNGVIINTDNKADNFQFSDDMLTLTINPADLTDGNSYICEVIFNGVVGQCDFKLAVNPVPDANYIDLDGDSPKEVKEGECATMSVKVATDFKDSDFKEEDFKWRHNPGQIPLEIDSGKYTLSNGGKTLKVCDADDLDEGIFEVCVAKDEVTDCVEIELRVLITCETDTGAQYVEEDTWKYGEFTECICTNTGAVECSCVEQTVECTDTEESYYDEDCKLICTRSPAECLVTGDPHYKTFDGSRHHFQGGNCRFTLVSTEDFQVIGTNVDRDGKEIVAWNDAVELNFKGLNLYLGPAGRFTVDNKEVFLPYRKEWRTQESISVIKAGTSLVVTVKLPNDLEALSIVWDGNSTVSTTIHGKYFEGTSGLCGTWDENGDNDLTGSGGDVEDVTNFGWSWKAAGDECETEPERAHPCDKTFFPKAKPIADEACDVLMAAPFSACHGTVDVEAALFNCKYDTCSCSDRSCACHAVKTYAKQCVEAGVTALDAWRDVVDYCPLTCEAGLFYDACGSFCPPTCADKEPQCGNLAGQCNEGCFCPGGRYLQGDQCVAADACTCSYQGEVKNVGDIWLDTNKCSDCGCRGEGEVVCEKVVCKKCNKKEQAIYESDDACCATCVEDWLTADPDAFVDVPQFTDITLRCESVVKPNAVAWFYSEDNGESWQEIEGANKLEYTLEDITPDNGGIYKCQAKKNYRIKEVEISLKVGEAPASCTATVPENGAAEPGVVDIGGDVTYSCNDGFALNGKETGKCQKDGTIDNVATTCVEATIETVSFGEASTKVKKGKVNLSCTTNDKSFGSDANIAFYWLLANGSQQLISDKPKYKKKGSKSTYSVSGVDAKNRPSDKVICSGKNGDESAFGSGSVQIM